MIELEIDWDAFEEKCKGCVNENVKCRLQSCTICHDICACHGCAAHNKYIAKKTGDSDV